MENNKVYLIGEIVNEPVFHHMSKNTEMYYMDLKVARLSENIDVLPLLIPKSLLVMTNYTGKTVEIWGQIRSCMAMKGDKKGLSFNVLVKTINECDPTVQHENQVNLNGFFCSKPTYRFTPLGREIGEVMVAVNRRHRKTDYIPCIAWKGNARRISTMKIGQHVEVLGRLQSRCYSKKLGVDANGRDILDARVVYEVSIYQVNECRDVL